MPLSFSAWPTPGEPEDQRALHAAPRQHAGRDARGRQHLRIVDRQPDGAQPRRLHRRRIGAAVGQHHIGNAPLAQPRQHLDGAGQHVVGLAGAIAQHQRAVEVEHETLDAVRGRFTRLPSCASRAGIRASVIDDVVQVRASRAQRADQLQHRTQRRVVLARRRARGLHGIDEVRRHRRAQQELLVRKMRAEPAPQLRDRQHRRLGQDLLRARQRHDAVHHRRRRSGMFGRPKRPTA